MMSLRDRYDLETRGPEAVARTLLRARGFLKRVDPIGRSIYLEYTTVTNDANCFKLTIFKNGHCRYTIIGCIVMAHS